MKNPSIAMQAPRAPAGADSRILRAPRLYDWRWILLVGLLCGISGGVRRWREWQFSSLARESGVAPFALKELPTELGDWRVVEGSESTLEPDIAQVAGASDHLIRTYISERSGASAVVMVIYGLATRVWAHTPDVCYPASGFDVIPPTQDIDIPIPEMTSRARFRVLQFAKFKAGHRDFRRVYYSCRNAGEWGLDMGSKWKRFRHHPGMYKIQIQTQAGSLDDSKDRESLERFLGELVREIERKDTRTS
jgi:Protein of unknown function (DUF3485)